MKLIFEGKILKDIIQEMEDVLSVLAERKASIAAVDGLKPQGLTSAAAIARAASSSGPFAEFVEEPLARPVKPVDKPVEKKERTAKQKANDERLRVQAAEKKAAGTMFKKTAKAPAPSQPEMPTPPPPKTAEGMDPAEVARNRLKTIEDLQQAYANGHQKEVFELLSRFGNGAKSFRELPPESFVPIREAIDNGGLT